MNHATITGLHRVSDPKPNKAGSTILAFFDCETNGFCLHGCALVQMPRHGLTVWPPKLEQPTTTRRTVKFVDNALRDLLTDRARAAYLALGGTDAGLVASVSRHEDDDDAGAAATDGLHRMLGKVVR